MRKIGMWMLAFLCAVCFMAGCAGEEQAGEGSCWSNISAAVSVGEEYYVVYDSFLYTVNPGEQKANVWCNLFTCDHKKQSGCPAALRREFGSTLCTDGKYLYLAAEAPDQRLVWYRYLLEEGADSREEYAEITETGAEMDCSLESFFHDGTVYYSLGQPDDSGVWSWKLYRQKLSGKKGGKAEMIYEPEAGTHLENISLYGTRVYASEWKEGGSGRIFSCENTGRSRRLYWIRELSPATSC